jgi:hypothetical protein
MIEITVRMIPQGDQARAYIKGVMRIANDGTGTKSSGNYKVFVSRQNQPEKEWKSTRFQGFPRRVLGVWQLIYCALLACGVDEVVRKRLARSSK